MRRWKICIFLVSIFINISPLPSIYFLYLSPNLNYFFNTRPFFMDHPQQSNISFAEISKFIQKMLVLSSKETVCVDFGRSK